MTPNEIDARLDFSEDRADTIAYEGITACTMTQSTLTESVESTVIDLMWPDGCRISIAWDTKLAQTMVVSPDPPDKDSLNAPSFWFCLEGKAKLMCPHGLESQLLSGQTSSGQTSPIINLPPLFMRRHPRKLFGG